MGIGTIFQTHFGVTPVSAMVLRTAFPGPASASWVRTTWRVWGTGLPGLVLDLQNLRVACVLGSSHPKPEEMQLRAEQELTGNDCRENSQGGTPAASSSEVMEQSSPGSGRGHRKAPFQKQSGEPGGGGRPIRPELWKRGDCFPPSRKTWEKKAMRRPPAAQDAKRPCDQGSGFAV